MFKSIEPVGYTSFQVAWESTLKCNMDCSYCADGHNNKIPHPSLEDSLKTVDFIFEYLEIQMRSKPEHLRMAGINIQGGESLFHPDIDKILEYIQEKKQTVSFTVSVAMITNAVAGKTAFYNIIDLVDHFTVSYHAEMNSKQQQLFKDNVRALSALNKSYQVNVMMHPKYWKRCISIISWLKYIGAKTHLRQIDHHWFDTRFNYTQEQVLYLTGKKPYRWWQIFLAWIFNGFDLDSKGRSCCGGNDLCTNGSCVTNYVEGNNFRGWSCAVDKFFLYIRQTTGEVYTNKDCRMNWDKQVGPIGNLKDTKSIIDRLLLGTPTIVCQKKKCWCGLCAPKAESSIAFNIINQKYINNANLEASNLDIQ